MTERKVNMSIIDAIYSRLSVRSYSPERLDETTIRTLLAAAVRAPTAVHLEPWTFAILQDTSALKRLRIVQNRFFSRKCGARTSIEEDMHSTFSRAQILTCSIMPALSSSFAASPWGHSSSPIAG